MFLLIACGDVLVCVPGAGGGKVSVSPLDCSPGQYPYRRWQSGACPHRWVRQSSAHGSPRFHPQIFSHTRDSGWPAPWKTPACSPDLLGENHSKHQFQAAMSQPVGAAGYAEDSARQACVSGEKAVYFKRKSSLLSQVSIRCRDILKITSFNDIPVATFGMSCSKWTHFMLACNWFCQSAYCAIILRYY